MPKPKQFDTEAALCAAFIAEIGDGWTAYAETAGWDILLVRKLDGFQIGIQAKLKFNVEVLNQALEEGWWRVAKAHPDCIAVLVPADSAETLGKICGYLGITVIRMRPRTGAGRRPYWNSCFTPMLPERPANYRDDLWYDLATLERHKLPEFVPDVAAGAAAPIQLTDWKIKALRLTIILEKRGYLTRRDFAHFQVDHRRWVTMKWLRVIDGRYVKDERFPDFRAQHPRVYGEIESKASTWMPTTLLEPVGPKAVGML